MVNELPENIQPVEANDPDHPDDVTEGSQLGEWLPSFGQMSDALRLRLADAIDGDVEKRSDLGDLPATSMRQGFGMIVVAGLIAGLIPFVVDLIQALAYGTAVPLAQMASQWDAMGSLVGQGRAPFSVWREAAETVAGLDPIAPGWLAAFLSALGGWIDWPLRWLTSWIVYGLTVLVIAKLLGAPTTLQRFYAGVSYAYLPLLLLGLTPIPFVGWLFALAAWIWALIVYVRAVRVVAEFDTLRAFVSVISPLLIGLLVSMAIAAASALSVLRLYW